MLKTLKSCGNGLHISGLLEVPTQTKRLGSVFTAFSVR